MGNGQTKKTIIVTPQVSGDAAVGDAPSKFVSMINANGELVKFIIPAQTGTLQVQKSDGNSMQIVYSIPSTPVDLAYATERMSNPFGNSYTKGTFYKEHMASWDEPNGLVMYGKEVAQPDGPLGQNNYYSRVERYSQSKGPFNNNYSRY
jgi:hypothetical protein